MHVVATAGHVDHGKSSLVTALTGQQPDRLAEERRRGLSIELGYCWTTLTATQSATPVQVAFVDVPGHERFLSTMLAGIGPVSAALLVVAADDPWMPQAAEHLAALDAFRIGHGVVAVSRSDLADPTPMVAEVRRRIRDTSLADARVIAVSATSGLGLADLRAAIVDTVLAAGTPAPTEPVRFWVDRRFVVRGIGTVVTGTLPAGRIEVGDQLVAGNEPVRVRGIETLGEAHPSVQGPARVALALGHPPDSLRPGSPLVSAASWTVSDVLDVRVYGDPPLPAQPRVHLGSAAVPARLRPLAAGLARLTLTRPLPLHVGDRLVLRDPGSRRILGAVVLDPMPPPLIRRGAALTRAEALAGSHGRPDQADEVRRRGVVAIADLRRLGVPAEPATGCEAIGDWLIDPDRLAQWRARLTSLTEERRRSHPLDPGLPSAVAVRELALPDPSLLGAAVVPPLTLTDGYIADTSDAPPAEVSEPVRRLAAELSGAPFAAPTAARLAELGLDRRAVAAAVRAGLLLKLADGIVLLPGAAAQAAERLAELPQPFTVSQARERLATSRRVALPLLAHLDAVGVTERLPDDRRTIRRAGGASADSRPSVR